MGCNSSKNKNKKPATASEKGVRMDEMKTYHTSSQRPIDKRGLQKYVPPSTTMGSSNYAKSFNESKAVARPTRTNRAFALRQQLNTKNERREQSATTNDIGTTFATKGGSKISRTGMGRYSVRKPNGKKHLSSNKHEHQLKRATISRCIKTCTWRRTLQFNTFT